MTLFSSNCQACRLFRALVVFSACLLLMGLKRQDPADIEGVWNYRTRSNCGTVVGVGRVTFKWNVRRGGYSERGRVYWSDSRTTIRWWGTVYHDASGRRVKGRLSNSLGDRVDGNWQIQGPDRLVVRWKQTNGCRGTGIATRAGVKKRSGRSPEQGQDQPTGSRPVETPPPRQRPATPPSSAEDSTASQVSASKPPARSPAAAAPRSRARASRSTGGGCLGCSVAPSAEPMTLLWLLVALAALLKSRYS